MPAGFSAADFYYLLPEVILTIGALLVLLADVLMMRGAAAAPAGETPSAADRFLMWLSLAVLVCRLPTLWTEQRAKLGLPAR